MKYWPEALGALTGIIGGSAMLLILIVYFGEGLGV